MEKRHNNDQAQIQAQTQAAKKLVISGYYGFGNSGDEAVLHAILLGLAEQAEQSGIAIDPVVLSIDPEATARLHGVKAVHRLKMLQVFRALRDSDGLVSGGGSLLQDKTGLRTIPYYISIIKLAQWLKKPTFIFSQGMGPIKHSFYFPLIRNAFRHCSYISIRDTESVDMLRSIGLADIPIDVAADPVMGLPLSAKLSGDGDGGHDRAPDHDRGRDHRREDTGDSSLNITVDGRALPHQDAEPSPVIGVSVRFWHPERHDLRQVAEALRIILKSTTASLRFLPFHPPKDTEASRYVIELLGEDARDRVSIRDVGDDPKAMLAEVKRCDLVIGMRLHSLIYAAAYYIPMVGISYDPKIDHFLRRLEMTAAGSTEEADPARVAEETIRLLDRRKEWAQEKEHLIHQLKKKSQLPAQQICQYLRTRG